MKKCETKVFEWSDEFYKSQDFQAVAKALKGGKTVVFPTETVYGLGGNGLMEASIDAIYEAKGRPSDNPLILHIAKEDQLADLVETVNEGAKKIMAAYWPGPLTLIFKKSKKVPLKVTGGLETVAVRMPDHRVAQSLIEASGVPVAAPSANISGRPSPTNARRVIEDLMGRVDYIIDYGDCKVGLESTILDVTGQVPMILRPGQVTQEMIEAVAGNCELDPGLMQRIESHVKPKAPGMKYKHYAPEAEVIVVNGDDFEGAVIAYLKEHPYEKIGLMGCGKKRPNLEKGEVLWSVSEAEYGASLFENLRAFDGLKCQVIFAKSVKNQGFGIAIMNRLLKAADGKCIRN